MMVVNTMLHHTELFSAYIAIDPSLWWDEQLLVKQAQAILKEKDFKNKSFYMAVANTQNSKEDFAALKKDTANLNFHLRSEIDFLDLLSSNKDNGLTWGYDYFKNETHSSLPLIGQYNALRTIFDYHAIPFAQQLWDDRFNADSALSAHYKAVSNRMGYAVLPPEGFVNMVGHSCLDSHWFDRAEHFFNLNITNYPGSAVVYAAMGDLYKEKKDNIKAISYYKKSLQLKNDPEVARKIKALPKS
jgi:hypothetical protein